MAEPKIPYKDKRSDQQVAVDRARERDQSMAFKPGLSRMQEIVGQGIGDLVDFFVPQSVEDVALDLSPIGKAIGLIPPKFVKPLIEQLKNRVLNNPMVPYKDLVEEAIDTYPRVSAHVGNFNKLEGMELGKYDPHKFNYANVTPDGEYPEPFLRYSLDENLPISNSRILLNPNAHQFMDPRQVLRHEMTHAAQDAFTPLSLREYGDMVGPYGTRPVEVGARMSMMPQYVKKNVPFKDRVEFTLNDPTFVGKGQADFAQLDQLNKRLMNMGLKASPDPTGKSAFVLERIILDKP